MKKINYLTDSSSPQSKGRKQEKIARQTINSGTVFFDKADLEVKDSNDEYRVDVKYTENKSYSFKIKDLDKFYSEASPQTPVYIIYLGKYRVKCIVEKV